MLEAFVVPLKVTDFRREPPEIYFIQKNGWQIRIQRIHFPLDTFFRTQSPQKLAEAVIIS